jgi:Flp pilus assembly protein TadD
MTALDAFRRAAAVYPTYAAAYFQMGRALETLGDPQAADGAYARARQLNRHLVSRPRSGSSGGR